jgi:gas vesicle protein
MRAGGSDEMSNKESAGPGSLLLAFILGAVSGAAVALLYAPATGREAREYLGDRAREGRAKAAEAAERGRRAVERGRQVVSEGKDVIANAIERGREAYTQARTEGTA